MSPTMSRTSTLAIAAAPVTLALIVATSSIAQASTASRYRTGQVRTGQVLASQYKIGLAPGDRYWSGPARPGSGSASNPSSWANLPQTGALDGELRSTQQQLTSLSSRLDSINRSISTARHRAQDIANMVRSLGRLDDKVKRIKRQLDSIVRIPQLRLVRPLADALGRIQGQLHSVRRQADSANRSYVQPLVAKLRSAEQKVTAKRNEVRQVASQTQQARGKLSELRGFVASRGYRRAEVSSLESLARSVRPTVRPVGAFASDLSRSLSGVDREFAAVASKLEGIARAKSAVAKLDRDLAKADKAARDLDKVLSKKVSIKFPKKISISVRQVIEAPGKLIDIVLKPLQKLAEAALKPVLSKFQIRINMPREITALPGQMNGLRSINVNSPMGKIESALRKQVPRQFTSKVGQLLRASTASLTR
ncbi:MAG: hypothetical protein AAF596_01210 [Planctomycetota bacterium]